jgi:hypothetical protein
MGKKKHKKPPEDKGPPIDTFLQGSARLRVAGYTWDEIAEEFDRGLDTVKHWPGKYPKRWAQYMREAIDDALGDIENDALAVSKKHLEAEATIVVTRGRGENKTMTKVEVPDLGIRQKASQTLLSHCRELRGTKLKLEGGDPDKPLLSMVITEAKKPKKK